MRLGLVFPMFWVSCETNVLGSLCVIFIGFSNVLGSLCVTFIGFSSALGSLCVIFIGFSNVLGSLIVIFIVFSNVSVFWKPKTLEKPIKTVKTIIFKLSPDGGVALGDNLKIMFPIFWAPYVPFFLVLGCLQRPTHSPKEHHKCIPS